MSMIGQGYYDTFTPAVLRRNILENPAWYTAYTPYQPEISQGRLEALLNFQTMVADLTGLEVANASLLDEGTAAAEAMTLMHRAARGKASRLAVDVDLFTQTAAILAARAQPLGIEIVTSDLRDGLPDGEFFGVITQLPGASGRITDWSTLVAQAHERGALVAVGADLLALTLITPPGSSALTSPSAPPKDSVCQWDSAAPTQATCRCTPSTLASCQVGWSGYPSIVTARRRIAWRCRPASSTSVATRPPATFAPRRCCWR
ncbi:glycine cleavage system P-family protein [Mycobacterium xenopi 3993]|nr:glycine cleavage system P-family protein [Mycobacterium xenopi 3993]